MRGKPLTEVEWDDRMVAYDFPLRPDLLARIVLPFRLTERDAKRVEAFVAALAIDDIPATPGETP